MCVVFHGCGLLLRALTCPFQKGGSMRRLASYAMVAVLVVATAARAAIVDPVFVRGNKNLANGWFDHLGAFESASDMVSYQNQFWAHAMSNPNYDKSAFFDGTNYYWVDWGYLHNFGPHLANLVNDQGADTQPISNSLSNRNGHWFADGEGHIYCTFYSHDLDDWNANNYIDAIRRYDSIADLLADRFTDYDCTLYSMNDRFVSVNGKYYRTNTDSSLSSPATVTGIAEYDSFNDLLTDTWSARHDGGFGLAYDLFMTVPRSALLSVPEPSTYAMALAGMAVGGHSMWRRRTRLVPHVM